MKGTVLVIMSAAFLRLASPAEAQSLSFRGVGAFGMESMTASESFDAVVGSSSLGQFGGGVQVVNLWKSLFVEATVERSKADGERVFVSDGTVFPLGIPLQVTMTPVDVVAGWRFRGLRGVVPYAGGGFTSVGYREESSFDDSDGEFSERGSGFVVLGGVEVPVWRWIHVRGELRYRDVSDVLGAGGASAVFDESSLGGFTYGVKVAVGR